LEQPLIEHCTIQPQLPRPRQLAANLDRQKGTLALAQRRLAQEEHQKTEEAEEVKWEVQRLKNSKQFWMLSGFLVQGRLFQNLQHSIAS